MITADYNNNNKVKQTRLYLKINLDNGYFQRLTYTN